jgi:hypothetical protein
MLKKASRFLIALLILLELGVMAISTTPTRPAIVSAALEHDMPVVFVDPPEAVADIGETFTISVKVFNLSDNFYTTEDAWEEGDPLPQLSPANWRYNYSLGHLYGIDLRLKWDPTILDYVSHTVMVPVNDHPGGILNGPSVIIANDNVSAAAGSYNLTVSSNAPASAFNLPDDNATAFTMTFTVKENGRFAFSFTNVDLPVDLVGLGNPFGLQGEIPHWTKSGEFRTRTLATRIESVSAGALVAGSLLEPVLDDEDATVRISMKNDNDTATDSLNLSLYSGTTLLAEWLDETLGPDSSKMFNHTIAGLDMGLHTVTAEASILHDGNTITDARAKNITVIGVPDLQISGPSSVQAGQTVSFSASESVHTDPGGSFTSYTWTVWPTGQTAPSDTQVGQSVEFDIPPTKERLGDWTIMLVVRDNYDITARNPEGGTAKPTGELLRPGTAPYRKTVILTVGEAAPAGVSIEWILLIVILIVIIALAVFYMRRRSR